MRKIFITFVVLALFSFSVFLPQMSAKAASCYADTCYKKDPMVYTNASGYYCANPAFTFTVAGAHQEAGTNGTVEVNLRYSNPYDPDYGGGCQANWSRAYVRASISSTKQLAAKAYEKYSPSYRHTRYIQASPLPVNSMIYSFMIDGSVTVTAVAAISGTFCSADYGDPESTCSIYYDPNTSYYG